MTVTTSTVRKTNAADLRFSLYLSKKSFFMLSVTSLSSNTGKDDCAATAEQRKVILL